MTFVLLHGSWHGAWCWQRVADHLRSLGHRVTTPNQTGVGERSHLISADITLDTFVEDIVNHITHEELDDIVFVGHSFGGIPMTGVADRMPERIRHLVYLDSLILQPGKSLFSTYPPHVVEERKTQALATPGGLGLPAPPATFFGMQAGTDDEAWVQRRLTPQPLSLYSSPLNLKNPIGNGLPRTYIYCTDPAVALAEPMRQWVRDQGNWGWREIATGHNAMITAPEELTAMLLDIGRQTAPESSTTH
ncbi:MAG: alpha/beta fold hydrolase [Pseudomonadota bacterium]